MRKEINVATMAYFLQIKLKIGIDDDVFQDISIAASMIRSYGLARKSNANLIVSANARIAPEWSGMESTAF